MRRKEDKTDEDEDKDGEVSALSAEMYKLEEGKIFENLKMKHPEVFRRCLRLWKEKKLIGMYVNV